jgi:hypothetical protein
MKRRARLIKQLLFLGIILHYLSANVLAQRGIVYGPYSKIIFFADSLNAKNKTDTCMQILEHKLAVKDTLNLWLTYYNLAVCGAARGDAEQVCNYLLRCIVQSPLSFNLILTDTDFGFIHDTKQWRRIESKIHALYLRNCPNITERKLAIELYHIFLKDQHARGLGLKKIDKAEFDHDEENLKRVEEIIEQYGWPTISMVGKQSAQGAFYVIQHADLKVQMKYIRLISEAARRKEINQESFAMLNDRITTYKYGWQLYGTQVYQVRDTITGKAIGGYKYFRIKDEKNVDKRRKDMGLIPVKEYFAVFGINYKAPVLDSLKMQNSLNQ